MDELKVGIIGSGFIAEHHCLSYSQLPNVDIVGLSSLNEKEAKDLKNKYKIQGDIYRNYESLLKLDCDAISVCVPNYLHHKITVDILNSGQHALVEKPLARTVEEAREMLDTEKSSNRHIFYCENNIFAPSFSKVKEIIEDGALGQIYMGRGKEQHLGPHSAWFYNKKQAGGGALLDLGVHDIGCLYWYLNSEVKEVFCQTRIIKESRDKFGKCEVEDNAMGYLYFENGAMISIEESWTAPGGYDMRCELYGTEGHIKVAPTFSNQLSVFSEKGYGYAVEKASSTKGWTFPVPSEPWSFGYPQEIQYFVECILTKKNPLTNGYFGLKILNIIETMYKSAETKKIEEVLPL